MVGMNVDHIHVHKLEEAFTTQIQYSCPVMSGRSICQHLDQLQEYHMQQVVTCIIRILHSYPPSYYLCKACNYK